MTVWLDDGATALARFGCVGLLTYGRQYRRVRGWSGMGVIGAAVLLAAIMICALAVFEALTGSPWFLIVLALVNACSWLRWRTRRAVRDEQRAARAARATALMDEIRERQSLLDRARTTPTPGTRHDFDTGGGELR